MSLTPLLIGLLKNVLYQERDEKTWQSLLELQSEVRDYVAILNLELVLDEAEGYAFLKNKDVEEEESSARLMTRRPLTYPVSLLLALLRKKLAEFDATGGDTRLVLSQDDIVEMLRLFLPDGVNEARLIDQIVSYINKVVELGFLSKLKEARHYEVKRILKAYVDAQWLADFDQRLAQYQYALSPELEESSEPNTAGEQP